MNNKATLARVLLAVISLFSLQTYGQSKSRTLQWNPIARVGWMKSKTFDLLHVFAFAISLLTHTLTTFFNQLPQYIRRTVASAGDGGLGRIKAGAKTRTPGIETVLWIKMILVMTGKLRKRALWFSYASLAERMPCLYVCPFVALICPAFILVILLY